MMMMRTVLLVLLASPYTLAFAPSLALRGVSSTRSCLRMGMEWPEAEALFAAKVTAPAKQRSPEQLEASFDKIMELYGPEYGEKIVKAVPDVLSFNAERMEGPLRAYQTTFGEEEAKAMVARNPLIMAVKAEGYGGADSAGKETLYASYVVEATRENGALWLSLLAFLLLSPLMKNIAGIH
ncbi:unnamed protein product [Chrysoparadoxa australica]